MTTDTDYHGAVEATFLPAMTFWGEDDLQIACSFVSVRTRAAAETEAESIDRWNRSLPPRPKFPMLKMIRFFLKFLLISVSLMAACTAVIHFCLLPDASVRMVSLGSCLGLLYFIYLVLIFKIIND